MVTSRFHKDEAVLQRDTMIGKVRTRRMLAFVGELVAMFALFIVMLIFLGPMTTNPPYFPIYPAIVIPLAFGAAFLGTGVYFKKRLYDLGDLSAAFLERQVSVERFEFFAVGNLLGEGWTSAPCSPAKKASTASAATSRMRPKSAPTRPMGRVRKRAAWTSSCK